MEKISLINFLSMDRKQIKKIVNEFERPKNIALMADGTRRILKLDPKYRDDQWLYEQEHINRMMRKVMTVVDFLFDVSVKYVIGHLISRNNILRPNYLPSGFTTIMDAFLDEKYCQSIIEKHHPQIIFYGDLEYLSTLPNSYVIEQYKNKIDEINKFSNETSPIILIGLGFSTDYDVVNISKLAIEYFLKNNRYPDLNELIKLYFHCDMPGIDIFIRTNEMRASGGQPPLLTQITTQWYVPKSPGIVSFSERMIRTILWDYLFQRIISDGLHLHQPLSDDEKNNIFQFYHENHDEILGIGQRVGDIWLST